ncbi:MAG: Sodium-dependent transporter [Ignavibacteriae bacterium]|nr:MAG: Sodium-dependent transporter [Ignavibacteriota bacterium]
MTENRSQWGTKVGFILAAAGSAIGLGNIWRFPYTAGENGGAAFVLVYLICVLLIGIPVLIAELTLGRYTQRNPVGAIKTISPTGLWKILGYLGVISGIMILSYYSVVAGWTIGYIFKTAFHQTSDFGTFIANPINEVFYFVIFLTLTMLVVISGVKGGIEKWSKILMPLLFLILLGLIFYSLTLPGAKAGIKFYLQPDFSKITGRTILAGLGQAFFSLSLGMGAMITYGSYLSRTTNLVSSATLVALSDTLIAVMAGLVIFPALFAVGMEPTQGAGLVFNVLPKIFEQMPAGTIVGIFFFILLAIAALTSSISLLEVGVAWAVDELKFTRKNATLLLTGITFFLGIPSALSQGASKFFTEISLFDRIGFLDIADFIFGSFALTFGGMLLSIFIGWKWGANKAIEEIKFGLFKESTTLLNIWNFLIRFVCPVIIFFVLLNIFKIF